MTRRDFRRLGFWLLLPALLFLHPALAGKTHFVGDVFNSFHPWLTHAAQSLQTGRLPLWNPYTACGEPLLANPQLLLFFPPAQVFWFLPFSGAWGAFLLLNQSLLFLSAFLLARRRNSGGPSILAALALAWGGFTVVLWEFPSAGATLSVAPLFLLSSLAGPFWQAAAATALLFLGGYAPFAYYAVFLAGAAAAAKCLSRRTPVPTFVWAAAVAVGVVPALVQILPTWELVRHSLRAEISPEEARAFLLKAPSLVKFLVPDVFNKVALPYSNPAFGAEFWPVQRNWLNTFFMGRAAFLLGAAGLVGARRGPALFLAGAAATGAALALGLEPLLSLLRWAVPGMRYMTHFSNMMWIALTALALLAAGETKQPRRRSLGALWGLSLALCLAAAASAEIRGALIRSLLSLDALSPVQDMWVMRSAWTSAAALALSGPALLLRFRGRMPLLCLLTLGELWLFGRDIHPWADARFFHERVPLAVSMLAESPGRLAFDPAVFQGPRVMDGPTLEEGYQSLRQALHPNSHLPFRVHAAWGYEVFPLKAFAEFRRAMGPDAAGGPQMDFVGGGKVLSLKALPAPARLAARRPNILLYENPGALNRVSWTGRAVAIPDAAARLEYLSTTWDPASETVLETTGTDAGSSEKAELLWDERPGRLRARGRSGPGWLAWSQVLYPGWETYVNGERAPLLRTNHAFMAVRTPGGSWTADFVYRPGPFRAGAAVAALSLAFALAAALLSSPKRRE